MVLITSERKKESEEVMALIISHFLQFFLFMKSTNNNSSSRSHAEQFNLIKIISLLSPNRHACYNKTEIGAAKKKRIKS
jgi:hypothetical protein